MIDLIGIAGAGLIVAGVAWMHYPSALIVAGVFLLSAAILYARRSSG